MYQIIIFANSLILRRYSICSNNFYLIKVLLVEHVLICTEVHVGGECTGAVGHGKLDYNGSVQLTCSHHEKQKEVRVQIVLRIHMHMAG